MKFLVKCTTKTILWELIRNTLENTNIYHLKIRYTFWGCLSACLSFNPLQLDRLEGSPTLALGIFTFLVNPTLEF